MSNQFEAPDVDFTTLSLLITSQYGFKSVQYDNTLTPGQRISARLYEIQTLDNLVGEMRCLINEATKRANHLKNILIDEV